MTVSLCSGLVFRRPDGAFVVLEGRLPDGTWAADLLEDSEGRPAIDGYPAVHMLVIAPEELVQYDILRRA